MWNLLTQLVSEPRETAPRYLQFVKGEGLMGDVVIRSCLVQSAHCPSLDTLQPLNIFLVMRGPELPPGFTFSVHMV